MGADWQKFDVSIPSELDDEDKLALGETIIDYIVKRTQEGKNNRGSSFPKYSKSYMKSLDFKIAGKTSKVDLTQTKDMLTDIEVLDVGNNKLIIGFEKGSLSNEKADGHITGWQGRSKTKRPFLGFEGSEKQKLNSIIKKYTKSVLSGEDERKAIAWISARDIKKSKSKKPSLPDESLFEDED